MFGRIFLLSVLVVCGARAAELTTLRAWQAPNQTRVVFELSGPVKYEVFKVSNPERVVVDLEQVNGHDALKLAQVVDERVSEMRYARRGANGLRVVLQLSRPVAVKDGLLPPAEAYGHRLVLDLLDRDAPATSAATADSPGSGTRGVAPAPTPLPVTATPKPASTSKLPAWRRDGVVIAVDAGHGGDDVGATGPRGTYEKDVVLAVARELAGLINQQPGMKAVLIRDGDYYIGLRERMERARARQADLFVSIHADAFHNPRVRGSSVFVLSNRGATSEAARWLAERENAADFVGGLTLGGKDHQLRSVLLDLSQSASLETSMEVADAVLNALRSIGPLHFNRIQQAGFMVLKSPDIPSLLVETAFISNPEEEQRLRNAAFRRKLAGAIRDGIMTYFDDRELQRTSARAGEASDSPPARKQHRVSPGETLSAIAMRYEISADEIRLANSLDTDTVRAGELLRIP